MRFEAPDGLYAVLFDHPDEPKRSFCAGFVVEDGEVTLCAPILKARWHKLSYWVGNGQVRWVGP